MQVPRVSSSFPSYMCGNADDWLYGYSTAVGSDPSASGGFYVVVFFPQVFLKALGFSTKTCELKSK